MVSIQSTIYFCLFSSNTYLGCPNCKAKRIKCTEELPSCRNCIKKNYRCGYMDFPEEKLEVIRKKNEKKKEEINHLNVTPGANFVPSTPQPQILHPTSAANSIPNSALSEVHSLTTSISPHIPQSQNHSQPSIDQSLQYPPDSQSASNLEDGIFKDDFYNSRDSLRMSLFKDAFFKLSKKSFPTQSDMEDPFSKIFSTDYNTESSRANMSGELKSSQDAFHVPNLEAPVTYVDDEDANEILLNQGISGGYSAPIAVNFENSKSNIGRASRNLIELSKPKQRKNSGNSLPNAINSFASFPKLNKEDRLRNTYLERYLKRYKKDVKSLFNDEYKLIFAPVWTHANADSFWTTVFNQSVVLDVYFSFFMDRALNVLLRECKIVLNGEVFSNSIESQDDLSLSASETSMSSIKSSNERFFFTKRDLDILTQKSYRYYGALIRDLRESISDIHIEYPLKISLFAAWATFFHFHSTVDTLCLMYNGTSTLLMQVLNNAENIEGITPTIRVTLDILNDHATASLIPDYNFNAIREVHEDFITFKKIFLNRSSTSSPDDRKRTLENKVREHDCIELGKFLDRLTGEFFPKIQFINQYYGSNTNRNNSKDSSIYFTSVRLVFDLLVAWFEIFPSNAVSIGSRSTSYTKTFYLFYSVIGRALVHVLTPIRSLLLVDPCYLFCPRFDFNPAVYKVEKDDLGIEEYNYLCNLSEKMLRMVSFFDYRMLYYSYYLSTTSILSSEYIKSLDEQTLRCDEDYNDIVELRVKKLPMSEAFIGNFSASTTLNANHFPMFDVFYNNNAYNDALTEAQQAQSFRKHQLPNKFDYTTGFFTHDFDPKPLFQLLEKNQRATWASDKPGLQETRTRVQNFDHSRQTISNTVRNSRYQSSQ